MSHRHGQRAIRYSDPSSEWSDASSGSARTRSRGRRRHRAQKIKGVRATVEAAAEKSRTFFVDSVCEELCPRFRELEVQASRVDAIQDALLHLPAHKRLQRKYAELQKEMVHLKRQLSAVIGEDTGERRLASDGRAYTRAEFAAYYGKMHWDAAAGATECFGDVGEPMSLCVREKRSTARGRWSSLDGRSILPTPSGPENKQVFAPVRTARAPDVFDAHSPSESDAGESVASTASRRSRVSSCSSKRSVEETRGAEDEAGSLSGSELDSIGSLESESGSDAEVEEDTQECAVEGTEEDEDENDDESADGEEEDDVEDEEVEEISIKGKAYYASGVTVDARTSTGFTQDSNGPVYAIQSDDDVGDQVGEIVSGKPRLYKNRRVVAAAR